MILKGSQRAGGYQLAAHLLRGDENEHVEVHEIRGFMADDLHSAFQEAYAVSKGTRAKRYLFSLSLNPPPEEKVPIEVFEAAVEQIEQKLGLDGQPRAIVFHEKEGRRHAHAVWSRIDTSEMKAINLPHYKLKLQDVAKEMYLEHGWKMPQGFVNKEERNPLNFTHEEWQQARRTGHNPKELKRMFQECWAISDSRKAYIQALQSKGFALARGDRRGFVAVDYRGEVYAIAKYTGIRTKQVKERLGDPKELPSLEDAKTKIAAQMSYKLKEHLDKTKKAQEKQSAAFKFKHSQLVQRQRDERQKFTQFQEKRWNEEARARSEQLAKGLRGVWHRLTGKYARIKRQNERETLLALQRDRKEKDALIFRHMEDRQNLQRQTKEQQNAHSQEITQLQKEIASYSTKKKQKPLDLKKELKQASKERRKKQTPAPDKGPEPEI